mmetsp:Transcript_6236/g.11087  ORF Transcript_6236/g.11087 Transcript_6236/m.11087 type:complete len:261 (+) Transcript_6236:185-967(+)|eukprot:CAMPEP_0184514636 /NCGR_PEP_ID=MMETSP0198_2-20121128/4072_1 /TAXON_ID=1112570 /ORGANISM="Thraustochytrium sp., Strain LLF1b" /LENGTH=260 /DNA_ID=CAMNT_0026904845 /DNA_START=161 /DNA_END=943 /DNA_ORIENTATION=-
MGASHNSKGLVNVVTKALERNRLWLYLRNDIILGKGYPWDLVLLHSVYSAASWRSFVEKEGAPGERNSLAYNVVAAFLCHGFGGTTFRDVVIGQPPGVVTNADVVKAWLLAVAAVYYSPFDLVFGLVRAPRSLSGLTVTAFEAVDSSTTVCGSVEKAIRLFPESQTAPFVVAILSGMGGSLFRYLERKLGRGWDNVTTEWSKPSQALRRTLLYSAVYLGLRRTYGMERARLSVACFHLAVTLTQEISGKTLDWTRVLPLL